MALKRLEADGDVVFFPSRAFSATVNPVISQNATPLFIDSDLKTWNMDPNELEKAFDKYLDGKAVIVAHLYGLSADMDRITDFCKQHNVTLIEDAAESLGTTYKGRYTGTFRDYRIFSLHGDKFYTEHYEPKTA